MIDTILKEKVLNILNLIKSYWKNTRSEILKEIANDLNISENKITKIKPIKNENQTIGFDFIVNKKAYKYDYESKKTTIKQAKTIQSL